ncbi:MAG: NTP transferase domain-containing protein [Candidatus Thorarchaeota archaeon]|nr:NTP transferase domain-containing protein [Candidatus Thorarchaeota archaeon]
MMKALVLTAGRGNRLRPITSNRSKAMLMIAGRPLLAYILDSLRENGIRDIAVVVGHGREAILDTFQQGSDYGVHLRYILQNEQLGVENAILTARDELGGEQEFLLVNGDVLVEPEMVARTLNNHTTQGSDVNMLVTLVSNPEQFGTVRIGRHGTVEALVEKGGPERYVSNYAVAGVSVFSSEILDMLVEQRTMESAIAKMIEKGRKVAATVWEKDWAEFTWPWDLLKANRMVLDRLLKGKGTFIAESAELHKNVVLEGPVYIGEGSIVRPGTTLRGPVYIGKRVYIGNNSLVRDYACLCDGVHLGYAVETRNSMIFDRVNIGRMTYVADSIIGADSCIEAGSQMWNWRPGRKPLAFTYGDKSVQIPLAKFGAIIGDNVVVGVNSSIYPTTRIGENSIISPGCIIDRDIPPNSMVSVEMRLNISDLKSTESCP